MLKSKASMVFILTTVLLDSLGLGLVNPILPRLLQSLTHHGPSDVGRLYGLMVAANAGMLFIAAPIMGRFSDRFGRRPVILVALTGMGVNYVLAALANSAPMLFVAQMIAGACGANMSAAQAYMADVTPPERRSQNFGLLTAVFSSGFILGPSLGGLLADIAPRAPFYVAAGLVAANLLFGLLVLPESLPPERRRPFSLSGAHPFAALMRLPVGSTIRALAATLFLLQLARVMVQTNWVLYTELRFGWSARDVGFSLGVWGLNSLLIMAWLVRVVLPRLGERRTALFGLALVALGCVLYGMATQGWQVYAILLTTSVGFMAQPALQGMISRQVPANRQGEMQGALTSLGGLGMILGPIIANAAFGYFSGPASPVWLPGIAFYIASGAVLLAVLVASMTIGSVKAPAPAAVASAKAEP